MLDSIYIAMTGLHGYEEALRVISNDTTNMNTPGFKGSALQFSDLFYTNGGQSAQGGGHTASQLGFGLNTVGTLLNFKQGQMQTTGNDLDLAVDGQGLFVLKAADGSLRYTRDGQFKFNTDGNLISSTTGEQVMALDSTGSLAPVSIAALKTSAAKPTTTVTFSGNLPSTSTGQTVGSVTVIDAAGGTHTLSAKLAPVSGKLGSWTVTLLDGTTTVGSGTIAFVNGKPAPANATVSLTYTPIGQSSMPLTLDFSNNVTSFDSGGQSTLAVASQDGYAAGNLTKTTFDSTGTLVLTYANGQIAKGAQLALGRFSSPDAVEAVGNNEFKVVNGRAWEMGVAGAGAFGTLHSGMVENSNVDLSQEFSNLVIMQRGYQASSQVVSTANDMLSELFSMRGK
ncbi:MULTISPECIES: flagellar hook protein FlgE [Ralstonia solanacearum species complex]|uniref:flagellar hook protein FlgE n=1 Tax=Ralstonia solanacearum species complex TaxID=3116862 RepID=UPI000E595917|nr:flagellar hook-basal body complex protein [Ralstonia solanacearum]BEU71887.1 flagellar hook protein FlgE [Ralstonia pseudosolanacearum]AXV76805.1 flagellar biosynthesis protein FlgF [Ralstonia solanacearum]AXV90819.1 flagellar biosynthesis protein FlgF [Ralstonia solanacearum]AXW20582.1 flagellar biosynthesis protein FlgF [Ralstonia solanacearum]AXW61886.1 flagellar biosynthesis protein FlgF [Ralstonia solanacearum]